MEQKTCCLCQKYVTHNGTHLLYECKELKAVYENEWGNVLENMPMAMDSDLEDMSNEETLLYMKRFHQYINTRMV